MKCVIHTAERLITNTQEIDNLNKCFLFEQRINVIGQARM